MNTSVASVARMATASARLTPSAAARLKASADARLTRSRDASGAFAAGGRADDAPDASFDALPQQQDTDGACDAGAAGPGAPRDLRASAGDPSARATKRSRTEDPEGDGASESRASGSDPDGSTPVAGAAATTPDPVALGVSLPVGAASAFGLRAAADKRAEGPANATAQTSAPTTDSAVAAMLAPRATVNAATLTRGHPGVPGLRDAADSEAADLGEPRDATSDTAAAQTRGAPWQPAMVPGPVQSDSERNAFDSLPPAAPPPGVHGSATNDSAIAGIDAALQRGVADAEGTQPSGSTPADRMSPLAARSLVLSHDLFDPATRLEPSARQPFQPASAVRPIDDAGIDRQIVQAVRLQLHDGGGSARVALDPAYLGTVSITVHVDRGAVTASIQAENADVRAWIAANQPALRDALARHGLSLDGLHVSDDAVTDATSREARRRPPPEEPARPQRRRPSSSTFEIVI